MPYTIDNPPEIIEFLPRRAKEIWIAAYNAAASRGEDEGTCAAIAWAAVKKQYEKDARGNWMEKSANTVTVCSEITDAPTEIQVIPYGEHETDNGSFVLTAEDMDAIITDFDARRNDMVIDYEHQTQEGVEAPAAGWIKKLINRGRDGLWAVVEWTPRAKEYLRNREYRYLSPVFLKRISDNRVVRLLSAGLTNTPAIDGMVPLVNKSRGGDTHTGSKGKHPRTEKEERKMLKKLIQLLALKEDATEEQAMEAVKDLSGQVQAVMAMREEMGLKPEEDLVASFKALKEGAQGVPKEITEALELKEGVSVSEAVGTITAMKAGHGQSEDLGRKVKDLETKLMKKDAEEAVEQAMKDGKVTPAQREFFLSMATKDLSQFKAFAAKAPVVIKPGELAKGPGPEGGEVPDEVQAQVNKALGIDEETFRKHNKKEE